MVPPNFPTMKFFSSVFHSIIYSSQNAKLRQFFVGNLQKAWGRNVQMISSLGGARLIGSSCTLHIKLSVCVFSHVIIGHGLQTFPMRRSSLQMILHCSFQPELLQDPVHSSTYNMPHQYLPLEVKHRTGILPYTRKRNFLRIGELVVPKRPSASITIPG